MYVFVFLLWKESSRGSHYDLNALVDLKRAVFLKIANS